MSPCSVSAVSVRITEVIDWPRAQRLSTVAAPNTNRPADLAYPALYHAAWNADVDKTRRMVRILLERGADPNLHAPSTPLHSATDPEVIKMLITKGANVNAAPLGETPLMHHCDMGGQSGGWALEQQEHESLVKRPESPGCALKGPQFRPCTNLLLALRSISAPAC